MFRSVNVFCRKFSVAIVVATLLGGLAPMVTATSANADTIANGSYVCTTGLLGDVNDSIATYTITDGVVSNGSNCAGAVVIPAGVTEIGAFAFYGATALTSITLPSGVTSIEEFAFNGAAALKSITIPASVTRMRQWLFEGTIALEDYYFLGNAPASVNEDAFGGIAAGAKVHINASATGFGTGLTWNGLVIDRAASVPAPVPADGGYVCTTGLLGDGNDEIPTFTLVDGVVTSGCGTGAVIIPEGVTGIGNSAFLSFGGSAITSITLPESLTSIGDFAFAFTTALTSISIPKNVSSIGTAAFLYSSVTSFTVDQANANFSSVDGVLFDKNATTLISYPGGKTATSYVIPASVTNIGFGSFSYSTVLTSVTIPASVTGISDYAFYGASALTSITIPASVTSMGEYVFQDATALTSVTISEGVTSIGGADFSGATGLKSITIPASVTSIGINAFSGTTSLTDYYFSGNAPASVDEDAFGGVATGAKAHISASATGFGTGPTWNGLVLASALADGNYVCTTGVLRAGSDTSATYTVTDGVVSNGGNCSGAVVIAPGATSISQWAFHHATITSVTIPASVTNIGEEAFYSSPLKDIYFLGDAPTSLHYAAFFGIGKVTVHISATAQGFGNGKTWNDMVISIYSPSAPKIWGAHAGNGQVVIGAHLPRRNGGSAITGYQYTINNGATWASVDSTSTLTRPRVSGLVNGTSYTLKLRAINGYGAGVESQAITFTPFTVADAPENVVITSGAGYINLDFAAPLSDGGSSIIRYGYSIDGGPWKSLGNAPGPKQIKLTNGKTYSIRVVAQNAAGLGTASTAIQVTQNR